MAPESQAKFIPAVGKHATHSEIQNIRKRKWQGGLFAGIARIEGAGRTCAGGSLEFAAASSDAEGGDQLFQVFVSAGFACDIFFSAYRDKSFETVTAFFA